MTEPLSKDERAGYVAECKRRLSGQQPATSLHWDRSHQYHWALRYEATCQALEAKLALHRHIAECETCRGPYDGCEDGQELEGVCIDQLGFDPYETEEPK